MHAKKALILLNLGTPDAPEPEAVGRYLKQFLMDPDVIDIPTPLRWFLVKGLIVPRRKYKSAEAYQEVWTERGSPLMYHLQDLVERVSPHLADEYLVLPAMRYGSPSVQGTFEKIKAAGITDITVLPLYPQYSLAATKSSVTEALRAAEAVGLPAPKFIGPFFDAPEFLDPFSEVIGRSLNERPWDHLLFSFHGLPEKQVKKTDRSPDRSYCLTRPDCCERPIEANRDCYRHQCYETARKIAQRLALPAEKYSVGFQSRLTRAWIQPFSDRMIEALPAQGVKRLAVACPAFVADCLETLEEIQIRAKESFLAAGGEDLFLIPSLNSEPSWAQGVATLARRTVRMPS